MPWTNDPERFVVPAGMTEAEALIVRRQLQILSRLDVIMELVKDNRREIEQNRREIEAHNQELLDQNDTLQQIVLAAQHYEEEFMERVVGDQRSN